MIGSELVFQIKEISYDNVLNNDTHIDVIKVVLQASWLCVKFKELNFAWLIEKCFLNRINARICF